jgi:hypothetical protein
MTLIDRAIEDTEQNMKGSRGPRAKFFFCVAGRGKPITAASLIVEPIEANSAEEAEEAFLKLHEVAPVIIEGGEGMKEDGGGSGFYLAKGTGMSEAQRLSVTVSAEHMFNVTATKVKAEFRGWVVFGNGIKGFKDGDIEFKDDELVSILFHEPVDKSKKIPKPKLKKSEAIRFQDLKILG